MQPHPIQDQIIGEVSQIFDALGDVSRLKLLRALMETGQPLSQGHLAERTGLSTANTSKHLATLVRVGLISREPQGNSVFFRPAGPLGQEICSLVCGHVTTRIRDAFRALA